MAKLRAFSLIEILQTVVLLGIIATMSISFFKNVNTDTKLRDSTQLSIVQALQEANRQMCSDTTPYCYGYKTKTSSAATNAQQYIVNEDNSINRCNADYTSSATYKDGYCVLELSNVEDDCPAGKGMKKSKVSKTKAVCFAPPKCYQIDSDGIIIPSKILYDKGTSAGVQQTAKPLYETICEENGSRSEAKWDATIRRKIGSSYVNTTTTAGAVVANTRVSEICYRLWDLLNHKRQGSNDYDDIIATCNTTINQCFAKSPYECKSVDATPANNHYNMLLPNGIFLYNLSGLAFTDKPTNATVKDGVHIYIKYDKNPRIRTYNNKDRVYDTNTTFLLNAVIMGAPNNLDNLSKSKKTFYRSYCGPVKTPANVNAVYIPENVKGLLYQEE